MEDRLGSAQANRPSNVLDGDLGFARLMCDDSKQMPCVRLIRLDSENVPVDLLRQLQPPSFMVLDRNRQSSEIVAITQMR